MKLSIENKAISKQTPLVHQNLTIYEEHSGSNEQRQTVEYKKLNN